MVSWPPNIRFLKGILAHANTLPKYRKYHRACLAGRQPGRAL